MIFKKTKKKRMNPEIKDAIGERDELISDLKAAVRKVDHLQDELVEEYMLADEQREEDRWS